MFLGCVCVVLRVLPSGVFGDGYGLVLVYGVEVVGDCCDQLFVFGDCVSVVCYTFVGWFWWFCGRLIGDGIYVLKVFINGGYFHVFVIYWGIHKIGGGIVGVGVGVWVVVFLVAVFVYGDQWCCVIWDRVVVEDVGVVLRWWRIGSCYVLVVFVGDGGECTVWFGVFCVFVLFIVVFLEGGLVSIVCCFIDW